MNRLPAFVLAAALAVAAALVGTPASAAPQWSTDITFDGYCDGLHLNRPSLGLGSDYTIDGSQIGCVSGDVFGVVGGRGANLVLTGFGLFTRVNRNYTWTHYGLNGNQIYVVNSGTWSYGPPAGSGVSSATPRGLAAAKVPLAPTADYDISFDGYCDGMHFVSPSAGLGRPGTVDGERTGCVGDPLMGSRTVVNGQYGTFVVGFFADGVQWLETVVYRDHTWVHYGVSGGLIFVLNSGTWSVGPPTGPGTGSSTG